MNTEEPRRRPARRGVSLTYKGKALLSTIDPITHAERIAQTIAVSPKTLYLCPSPIFGYGIETLLSRIPKDSTILCVEAEEALYALTKNEFPALLAAHPQVGIIRARSVDDVRSYVRQAYGPRRFRKVATVKLNGGYALNADLYDRIEATLRDDVSLDWFNAMTIVKLGRRYALNAIRNLGLLPHASSLKMLDYGDAPILVLGAGPSLDNAELLLMGKENYRIVCVDTALLPLISRGVKPDLVVALEAQQWNLRDFIGVLPYRCDLAMDLSSLPRGADALGGHRYLFSVSWSPLRFLDRLRDSGLRPPEFPPLGSVGLSAVDIAMKISKGPIIIAGLDFAYDIGAYHARSAPSRISALAATNRLSPILDASPAFRAGSSSAVGKNGAAVRTDPALRSYSKLLDREFGASGRIFDIGEFGLASGIPRSSADVALELLREYQAPRRPIEPPHPIAQKEDVLRFIDEERKKLESIRSHLSGSRAANDLDKLVDECDYLWAHFPECAGAEGKRPPLSDTGFLKRISAEVGVFSKALNLAAAQASG